MQNAAGAPRMPEAQIINDGVVPFVRDECAAVADRNFGESVRVHEMQMEHRRNMALVRDALAIDAAREHAEPANHDIRPVELVQGSYEVPHVHGAHAARVVRDGGEAVHEPEVQAVCCPIMALRLLAPAMTVVRERNSTESDIPGAELVQ